MIFFLYIATWGFHDDYGTIGKASGKANGIGQGGNTGRGPASKRGMYPS